MNYRQIALCCFASPAQAASPDETQVAAERLLGSDSEQAQWQSYLPVPRKLHAWGVVVGSLTASTEAAGVPPAAMIEAVQALATAIDPERDVKGGDLFWVQYEQEYTVEGDPIGTGRVLWAELRTAAKGTVAIHRFRIGKSSAEPFWLATGQSTETTAVRLPLNRISITSAFGLRADPFDRPMSPAWAIGPVRVTPSGNPKPRPANTLGKGNSAVDAEGRAMKTRAGASLTPLGLSMGLSPVPSRGAAAPSGAAARVVAPHAPLVMHANRGEHRTGREWRKRSSARRRSWTSREHVPRPRSARMRNDARLRVAWRQVLGRRHFTDERAEAGRRGKYLTCPVWVEAVARRSRDETIPVLRTYSSKV